MGLVDLHHLTDRTGVMMDEIDGYRVGVHGGVAAVNARRAVLAAERHSVGFSFGGTGRGSGKHLANGGRAHFVREV